MGISLPSQEAIPTGSISLDKLELIELDNIEIERDKDYLQSLKSLETENFIDRLFYRPLGYKLATKLKGTGVTPNFITIVSIFVGVAGAILFYYDFPYWIAPLGILGMVAANILDCVDGQLARMTGIKSKVGRILDGIAGYLWFATVYLALATRLYHQTGHWGFYLLIILSALSHATQAAVTDYYKTLHLYFLSPETGREFDTVEGVRTRLKGMKGIPRLFTQFYLYYTQLQHRVTPHLQDLLNYLRVNYPTGDIPETSRIQFRRGSKIVMRSLDLLTFNGRSIPLFLTILTGHVWLYFLYEIVFLNIVLVATRNQHETLCRYFLMTLRGDHKTV